MIARESSFLAGKLVRQMDEPMFVVLAENLRKPLHRRLIADQEDLPEVA